jgi:MFS family permease
VEPRYNEHDPGAKATLALALSANVLFGAGLFAHGFLYNFYLGELGFSGTIMGSAAAALTAGGIASLIPAGLLIDRWGIRQVYVTAAILTSIGLSLGAFAQTRSGIITSAVVAGAGAAAFRVVMGPLLLAVTNERTRARAFSWNVGLLVGSGAVWTLASGFLPGWIEANTGMSRIEGIRSALIAGAMLKAVSALMAVRMPTANPVRAATTARQGLRIPAPVLAVVAVIALWMTAAALVLPFFNVFFQKVHHLPMQRIGVLFGIAQAITAVALFASGEFAARVGTRRVLGLWLLIFAPALALLPLAASLPFAFVLYLVQGAVAPATNPMIDQLLLEQAPPDQRGAVSSWRNAATELAGVIGATAGGFIIESAGFSPLLLTAALAAAIGGAALYMMLVRNR